jgi:hypothetical protein
MQDHCILAHGARGAICVALVAVVNLWSANMCGTVFASQVEVAFTNPCCICRAFKMASTIVQHHCVFTDNAFAVLFIALVAVVCLWSA